MKTGRWFPARVRTLTLTLAGGMATLSGLPLSATAQQRGDELPPLADRASIQSREADDMALLLMLRPQQRPALDAFLQSRMLQSFPRDRRGQEKRDFSAASSDGFIERLDRMTREFAQWSADDTRRITVARRFYEGLDSAQRRAFDAVMRLRHGPGPGPAADGPMVQGWQQP